jgi:hypothetical protein
MPVALADIDRMLAGSPGFRIVNRLEITESGVDPIGLRQLNLDLMDATIPGINNVTTHIRPYAFMAWAWWKAWRVIDENGEVDPATMADLAARYEVMYAWAQCLAGTPFRGAAAIRANLPLKGSDDPFAFHGAKWEEFKKKHTSLMAPTEYGPSIKALRFLQAEEGGVFKRSREVEEAVMTIDGAVCSSISERLIGPQAPTATWQEIFPLAESLPIGSPSKAERDAFRFLFYTAGAQPDAPREIRRRKGTIDLLRAILPEGGEFIDVPEIRRRLAAGTVPDNAKGYGSEVRTSAALLAILQARQLQRLATEAMMLWIERSLSTAVANAKSTDELVRAAQGAAVRWDEIAASAATVGAYFDAVEVLGGNSGWPRAAALPDTDAISLMEQLSEAQRKDPSRLPALALRAFGIVYAVTKAVRGEKSPEGKFNPIEARPDRLPMGIMAKRIEAIRDKPLAYLWRDVIENWIIAQHIHWSAVRGTDGKKRLRIGLEGSGWIRVRRKPSTVFNATPDRLATLLSLGSECGLFARSADKVLHFGRSG